MATVYSHHLLTILQGSPNQYVPSSGPPAGKLWVIRDMVAFCSNFQSPGFAYGFRLTDNSNVLIWAVLLPYAEMSFAYHWTGRQVIEQGESLQAFFLDPAWTIRISGFALTLP